MNKTKRKISEARKNKYTGENHPCWKGGRRKTANGYIEIHFPGHQRARKNGYVFEHIVVLEEKLGRQLKPNEQCHHIDGNKQNNDPDNLIPLDIREHQLVTAYERRMKNMVPCTMCNQLVYKKPSEQRKRKNHFCSRTCLGKWSKENGKGVFVNVK